MADETEDLWDLFQFNLDAPIFLWFSFAGSGIRYIEQVYVQLQHVQTVRCIYKQ